MGAEGVKQSDFAFRIPKRDQFLAKQLYTNGGTIVRGQFFRQ